MGWGMMATVLTEVRWGPGDCLKWRDELSMHPRSPDCGHRLFNRFSLCCHDFLVMMGRAWNCELKLTLLSLGGFVMVFHYSNRTVTHRYTHYTHTLTHYMCSCVHEHTHTCMVHELVLLSWFYFNYKLKGNFRMEVQVGPLVLSRQLPTIG